MKPFADEKTTHGALLRDAARRLGAAGFSNARREAEWLLADTLGTGRAQLYAYPERGARPEAQRAFEDRLRRRLSGEPLQYILGYAEFYGLRLAVTPAVLIPRPETEQLVEKALHGLAPVRRPRVLDAGTGSGCIALALAHERSDAAVHACDTSAEALAVAHRNARRLGLGVRFEQADLLRPEVAEQLPGGLDLLISNPPYIPDAERDALPDEVRAYEPPAALFSGGDPLIFYRALAGLARRLVKPGGQVALETHERYAKDVQALFAGPSFDGAEVVRDLAEKPRILMARVSSR